MTYYIDGYNLIFTFIDSKDSLLQMRKKLVQFLQKRFAQMDLEGVIVFDGSHKRGEESGLSYPAPLIVAYTPKGQSADDYILEQIAGKKQVTVVTNDRGLILHAKSLGAKVQSNSQFIQWIKKKKKLKTVEEPKETRYNFERLLKIFEDRLKNTD